MKAERWHLSITLVCLLFGTLFISNLKTQLEAVNPVAARNKTLVNVVQTQEQKNTELESEITKIRDQIEKYHSEKAGQTKFDPVKKELDHSKFVAGLTKVEGPGLIITLDDQEKARTAQDPEFYMIHYSNLLYIVNDLRAAGAEAISVNNERIVSTSDIRCAGSIILVNTSRLAPPYEIKAIGNAEHLEAVVRSGEYSTLELGKFPVSLIKNDVVTIPAYTGSYTFTYALPPKEGAK